MSNLKIPVAKDEETNTYISPSNAEKKRKYSCIECKETVYLRRGAVKRAHFAHTTNTPHKGGEAAKHFYTKLWVMVNANNPNFSIVSTCPDCSQLHTIIRGNPLYVGYTEVKIDCYRVDAVFARKNGKTAALIEICNTNPCTSTKINALLCKCFAPLIEIDAVDVDILPDKMTFALKRDLPCRLCTRIRFKKKGLRDGKTEIVPRASIRLKLEGDC